ncbi:unnamed protein product [Adineta ricciae]|uniref:EF-hand domain-containing protein n=1 Tax=Adineta ricciae TaxID=249248 RepID=A0A813RSW8_ADIRI|nr:unnamed protein product [Adineta ricciae]CAF0797525.1 unnamed protein product [Adineta ricciae]
MKLLIYLLHVCVLLAAVGAPPVVENARRGKAPAPSSNNEDSDDMIDKLEYGRYLKEVVEILESDPNFKRKLEKASADDIKSGNIAEHLSLVQHNIRSQLDEAKQREMARLRQLIGRKIRTLSDKQRNALARIDPNGEQIRKLLPQHLDHDNSDTFNEADLERLIRHASKDLDEIDRQREEEFKQYELRKEYQRRAKLAKLTKDERKRLEELHHEALEQKKRHRPVNHPGSRDQMEEVWTKVDKLETNQFKPKAFFKLHDINGDGFLDEGEIEAIMLQEAAKIHDGPADADPVEKEEEMERMRQHVMREFDKNNDRMLSFEEFEHGIDGKDAKNDQGWKSIEDNPVFSDQEYQRFAEHMPPISTSIPPQQTPSTSSSSVQAPVVSETVANASSVVPANQPLNIPRARPAAKTQ